MDSTLILALIIGSFTPVFPDPYHPEKYGGEFRNVCFWEWITKELQEIISGVELKF